MLTHGRTQGSSTRTKLYLFRFTVVAGGFSGNTQFKNRKINTTTTDRQGGEINETGLSPGQDKKLVTIGEV